MQYLEAIQAQDLGIVVAGNHFAATQTMDEGSNRTVNFNGGFGYKGSIVRTITPSDADTISFTALLLKPGQNAGMDDEMWMRNLEGAINIAATRGQRTPFMYQDCAWTNIAVSSTLTGGSTLTADFSGNLVVPTN